MADILENIISSACWSFYYLQQLPPNKKVKKSVNPLLFGSETKMRKSDAKRVPARSYILFPTLWKVASTDGDINMAKLPRHK